MSAEVLQGCLQPRHHTQTALVYCIWRDMARLVHKGHLLLYRHRLLPGVVLCLTSLLLGALGAPVVAGTMALDVGHFLAHPGATSARGVSEFDFNRQLAMVVRHALEKQNFHVRLIGAAGDMSDLRARTRAAAGAHFFLSLHHDSVQPQYLETWVPEGTPRRFSDVPAACPASYARASGRNPPPVTLSCTPAG